MALQGFLTTIQAAEIIGVTAGRVRQLVIDQQIKGVERPDKRTILIPETEAERLREVEHKRGRPRGGKR